MNKREFKTAETTLRDDVLNLFVLYLENHGTLSQEEREAYTAYLKLLAKPNNLVQYRDVLYTGDR